MTTLYQQLFNGLTASSTYALVAVGITLVYGLTGIVNFAHGQFMVCGGYIAYACLASGLPFPLAAAAAVLGVAAIAWVLERAVFRHTLRVPLTGFIVSLGIVVAMQGVTVLIWTAEPRFVDAPITKVFHPGGVALPGMRIAAVIVSMLCIGVLFWVLERTRFGQGLRSLADDREAASIVGVPVGRYVSWAFVIGGALAGVAGALSLVLFPLEPSGGVLLVIKGFAVALVGGLGNVSGAVIASFVLGAVETLNVGYFDAQWTDAYAFTLMIFILLLRPAGIMGGKDGGAL